MKIIFFITSFAALFFVGATASAQPSSAVVVAACGTPPFTYNAGQPYSLTQNTNGTLCVNGTFTQSGFSNIINTPTATAQFTPAVAAGVSTLTVAGTKNLYTAYLTNTDTVAHWLWIVNSTSAPTNGTYTAGTASGNVEDCIEVAAGQTGSIGGLPIPAPYSAQPYLANSTTGCGAASNTLTLSTVGFMHVLAK